MNRTRKMAPLFQEKILRKKVDYQEECWLRMIKYKLVLQRKDYLGKFGWYIKEKMSSKTELFRNEK